MIPARLFANHAYFPDHGIGFYVSPKVGSSSMRKFVLDAQKRGERAVGGLNRLPRGIRRVGLVRNTWERLAACYAQKTASADKVKHLRNPARFRAGMSFGAFVRAVCDDPLANHHFFPQHRIIPDDCPEIWQLADAGPRIKAIFTRDFPRANRSSRAHYSVYYTRELAELVADAYAGEIRRFGFTYCEGAND